ncbi:MAG: glycosyltransferase [Bacteroidota bacterium]
MVQPEISVIMPFFNAGKTLQRALTSIADQTFRSFECIMVDNNSADDSAGIVRMFAGRDCRFISTEEKKQGVAFAFNRGASLAKGRYIARMDADDEALPLRLEKQFNFLENNPDYGAVTGLAEYIPHRSGTEGFRRYVDWSNSVLTYDQIMQNRFLEMPVINPTAMWRKESGDKHGLYRHGNFPEDYDMWLRWLEAGVKVHKLGDVMIRWYDSDTRLSRTLDQYSDEAFFRLRTEFLSAWLARNNPHHPDVAVWCAGRISRKWVSLLKEEGIAVQCYIDIRTNRQLDSKVIRYDEIPSPGDIFILVYMRHAEIRTRITEYLDQRGYISGKDYMLVG